MKKRIFVVSIVLAGLASLSLAAPAVAAGASSAAKEGLVGRSATALAASPEVTKPRASLTAAWWQTFLSISGDPLSRCDLGRDHVVYLAGTTGGTATRSCTIPAGNSILVPLINNECSTAEGNGKTPADLRACAEGVANDFTGLSLTVDGVPIPDLLNFRVQSAPFAFNAAAGNVFGVPAGGSLSVADGYWALIGPLSPGAHTVSFGGSYPPGPFTTSAIYNLTVTS
jgi:hypothetical protein